MTSKYYLTTAIDYANGDPHLGHAYEKIGADCIARYRRLRGFDVHFVIGMDEHGQNVAQSAESAGVDPVTWVDSIAASFEQAWKKLSISHTDFVRTTEARHRRCVEELIRRIEKNDYFYEGSYEGFYCVGCEAFKLEKDLEDNRCPLHPTRDIKWVKEPNYFFRLSAFQDRLLELYESNPDLLRPVAKMNELRNLVESGLQDTSVTRARLPWGIPWPADTEHTVYVWFDALPNYLTATGFPEKGFDEIWPADLHIIGPDITRFHAALWPAMMMAADLPVPKGVWAHGWITFSGARFSKSAGVTLTLDEAIDRHGADALRYFLLREAPWDSSGNFSLERFDGRYEAELADGYGNLASRVLAMITKYHGGTVPTSTEPTPLDTEGHAFVTAYGAAMDQHLLHTGAAEAWRLVSRANGFVEEAAPWALFKEGNTEKLEAVLAALARSVARITVMTFPFMPNKTREVWKALGQAGDLADIRWNSLENPPVGGCLVTKPSPLFPKPGTQGT